MVYVLADCEQDQDGTGLQGPLLCVQWKTPDDGQRNCPKHVEFYSKNKVEKSVYLVSFIVGIYHDARSSERQNNTWMLYVYQKTPPKYNSMHINCNFNYWRIMFQAYVTVAMDCRTETSHQILVNIIHP